MKIKDLIKYLETLDQEKELVILATDPTGWEYGQIVNDETITEEEVFVSDMNGLDGWIELELLNPDDKDDDRVKDTVSCYVVRMDC